MTKNKHILLTFFALLLFSQIQGQQNETYEVKGKVVEVTDGRPTGVPNVKVNVAGHYDITDQQGNFRLILSSKSESVTISLQNCQHPLISPRAGRVNLPPSGEVEIRVCAKQNRRLQRQVTELEGKVAALGRKLQLTERQLDETYDRLMDTTIYFENEIAQLENKLQGAESENEELQQQIEDLIWQNGQLQDQLQEAMAEKYLRQNEYFEEISSSLNEYVSTLYDFKDKLPRISACYSNRQAYGQMETAKQRYSAARDRIDSRHDAWVSEVQNYWDAPHVAQQLAETLDFLLRTVHDEQVYTMNESVFGPMKDWAEDEISQGKARIQSEAAVNAALPELNTLATQLEAKIDDAKYALRNSI